MTLELNAMTRYSEREYALAPRPRRTPATFFLRRLHEPRRVVPVRAVHLARRLRPELIPTFTNREVCQHIAHLSRQLVVARAVLGERYDARKWPQVGDINEVQPISSGEYSLVLRAPREGIIVKMRNLASSKDKASREACEHDLYAEQMLMNEAAIGAMVANRVTGPHFVRTLGIRRASLRSDGRERFTGERAGRVPVHYLLLEDMGPRAMSLSQWLMTYEDALHARRITESVIAQAVLALSVAHQAFEFSHNDLHLGNLAIVPLDAPRTLRYRLDGEAEFYVETQFLLRILDFGNSTARVPVAGPLPAKRGAWRDALCRADDPPLFDASGRVALLGQFRPDFLIVPGRSNFVSDVLRLLSSMLDFMQMNVHDFERSGAYRAMVRWYAPLAGLKEDEVADHIDAPFWKRWVELNSMAPPDIEIDCEELVRSHVTARGPLRDVFSPRSMAPLDPRITEVPGQQRATRRTRRSK